MSDTAILNRDTMLQELRDDYGHADFDDWLDRYMLLRYPKLPAAERLRALQRDLEDHLSDDDVSKWYRDCYE